MIKRTNIKKPDPAGSFDHDAKYSEGGFVPQDESELTDKQFFKKHMPGKFPIKIEKELTVLYPEFKCDRYKRIHKLAATDDHFFFYGKPGTGKTYAACLIALLKARHPNGWWRLIDQTKFISTSHFLANLRSLIGSKTKEVDSENGFSLYDSLIHKTRTAKILVIDDLGVEKATDFANEVLTQVIDFRYNYNKTTIATSNLDVNELSGAKGYARIMSRLIDMVKGKVLHFPKTYRKTEISPEEF